jgi:hypothetical protein
MIDWFEYSKNQKRTFVIIIVTGLLGFAIGGVRWSFYSVLGVLLVKLIFWACRSYNE